MRSLLILILGALLAVVLFECSVCSGLAHAEQELVSPREVADAIRLLQPYNEADYTYELAESVALAAGDHDLDYKVLVAVVMRESSFREDVESFKVLGARRERGLTQVAPGIAKAYQDLLPESCTPALVGHACQIGFGAALHAWWREHCPGSTWRWVSAYGRGSCPSEKQARQDWRARRANTYYQRIAGDGEW